MTLNTTDSRLNCTLCVHPKVEDCGASITHEQMIFVCTRPSKHKGDHIACGCRHVVFTWPGCDHNWVLVAHRPTAKPGELKMQDIEWCRFCGALRIGVLDEEPKITMRWRVWSPGRGVNTELKT